MLTVTATDPAGNRSAASSLTINIDATGPSAPTAMLVALSAAALSAAGVSLYHGGETALMVLLWHLGAVVVLSLLCLLFGRPLFAWIGYAKR